MGIEAVRKNYGVPAKVGGEIIYTNANGRKHRCKITGVDANQRLRCSAPGCRLILHPKDDGIQYL